MADISQLKGWLSGRLPEEWGVSVAAIQADEHEALVTLALGDVQGVEGDLEAARLGRIQQFRDSTREQRIAISQEAQRKFGRVVSWAAQCGDVVHWFTHLALPVMTRLRLPEREVLDALVASGVARSRAHALAWCVALVREHQGDWLTELRKAMESVQRVRAQAPKLH